MTERMQSGAQNEIVWENSGGYAVKLGELIAPKGMLIVSYSPSAHPYYSAVLKQHGYGMVNVKTWDSHGELTERIYFVNNSRLADKNWVIATGIEDGTWKAYAYEGKDDARLRAEVPSDWEWGRDPDVGGNDWVWKA